MASPPPDAPAPDEATAPAEEAPAGKKPRGKKGEPGAAPAKPKKAKPAPPPPIGSPDVPILAQDQGYDVVLMDRRLLEDYEFNPRYMSLEAATKLYAGLAKGGLFQPAACWNKRNQKLVGGHQRLGLLDTIHGSPAYQLRVCVVDLDEDQHAEACILLNNAHAMGEWNFEMLAGLVARPGVRREATGFGADDLYQMFGVAGELGAGIKSVEDANAMAAAFEKARERQRTLKKAATTRDSAGFYTVLIFPDEDSRAAAADAFGFDQERDQDGGAFLASHFEFLEHRIKHPSQHLDARAMGMARLLNELADPIRPQMVHRLQAGSLTITIGYLEQALAGFKQQLADSTG